MTIRDELASALRAALPEPAPRVIESARTVDAITEPVLMLERTTVAKPANAMGGYLTTFTLHLVSPVIDPDNQDTDLDNLLDNLLVTLDGIGWLHWDTATRSVFLGSWPSFQVAVLTVTEKSKGV